MSDYDVYESDTPPGLPSYPLTGLDLVGWVITGAAHVTGAVANTLGNIGREFFIAAQHKRDRDEELRQRAMFESDVSDGLNRLLTAAPEASDG